jgi:peptidoglycan hydrolase-like amidase
METAIRPHAEALAKMEKDIKTFQEKIAGVEKQLEKKALAIAEADRDLETLVKVAGERMHWFYIRSKSLNPMLMLLSSTNVGSAIRALGYQQAVANEDKKVIVQTAMLVKDLEKKKAALEGEKSTLSALKNDLDARAVSVRKLVSEATAYQTKLTSIISTLTSQQQVFIAQKLAGLNLPTSLGAGPLFCTDDRKTDPGFSPAFAFFTFGIPHRVGMNQYGALGRARAGQAWQDILRAYFANISFEKRDPNTKIKVQGYGEKTLEEYLLGVYEMPIDWPADALKAQIVAARSYVLAYTNNGATEICTTQACQVYKGGNKGGAWEAAVRETEGQVMVSEGSVIKAWYSSTDGGYTYTSQDVWGSERSWTKRLRDTNGDIGSFSDLLAKAYDRDSPCFYAAQGWRSEYGKSAWLKPEEVADIVNVILLSRVDGGTRDYLYQTDKPNPVGKETWGRDKVKDELRSRGITPFNSITGISASGVDFSIGRTTNISVSGDGGSVSFEGDEFRNFFNLRAPANIQIVGPLFTVEKK